MKSKSIQKSGGKIRTAIVGFGLSGQVFHAPFISQSPAFELSYIVSTGSLAAKQYPSAQIVPTFEALLQKTDFDLVVICSPNTLHFEQASLALKAGKHVVVEKPMVINSAEAKVLLNLAQELGLQLIPYHNRRWDGDFLTLQHIIAEGFLGDVMDYEVHFDRFNPEITRASWRYLQKEGGGTLFDLGTHLIDQAIVLFGKPQSVFAMLYNQRPGSVVDDSFEVKLFYSNITATLKASVFVKEPGPRMMVHGTKGSFVKYGLDPQEAWLRKGKKPDAKGYGLELSKFWGKLNTEYNGKQFSGKYETLPGNYMGFYNGVYESLSKGEKPLVAASDALLNLQIVEAAQQSFQEKRIISLS